MRMAVFLGSLLVVFGSSAWAQAPAEPSAPAATPAPVVSPAPPPGAPSRDPAASAESPAATSQPPAVVVAPAPAAAPAPALAAGPAAPARLLGLAAWSQVVGNTITGREEGKLLTEYYAADGSIKSMHGNELSTGQWALVGETVCVRYSGDPKTECYRVEVSGDSATFLDRSGDGTRYRM